MTDFRFYQQKNCVNPVLIVCMQRHSHWMMQAPLRVMASFIGLADSNYLSAYTNMLSKT